MTDELNSAYWQKRYQEGQTGWDIGEVSTPLKAYIDKLNKPELKILIPGCGFGHEGAYLYQLGYRNMHLLDFSSIPINAVRRKMPELHNHHFHVEDFFEHQGKYDLIFEQTLFCAIHPSLRRAYAEKVFELLNEGGKLVGLLFNKQFEGGPPFGGTTEEYRVLFSSLFSIVSITPCYNSIAPRLDNEVFIQLIK